MATSVPTKRSTGQFAVDKCLEYIEENGDKEGSIIIKSDQENSIEYLMNEIVEGRVEGRTIIENSPKQSSGSNAIVERGVQEIEGKMRALLLSLEERIGRRVDAKERIVAFIPEYAAYLLNRLQRGEDGMVPYERVKGKNPTILGG